MTQKTEPKENNSVKAYFFDQSTKQILDSVKQGVWLLDAQGFTTYMNPIMLEKLGYKEDEVNGKYALDFVDASILEHATAGFEKRKEGTYGEVELVLNKKNGEILWTHCNTNPIMDAEGKVIGILTFHADITEEKLAREKEAAQKSFHMAQLSKMSTLGVMVSGIAHEVNNPLSIIKGYSDLLINKIKNNKLDTASLEEIATQISQTTLRIKEIVNGLRFYAREGSTDAFEKTDLNLVLDIALTLCEEQLRQQCITVKIIKTKDPLFVSARPVQITQVILNLVSNACDAMTITQNKTLTFETVRNSDDISLIIKDNGPGIPIEIAGKIFDPFFTTKEVGKGTGLGLSICKGIMESHNGTIELLKSNAGAQFRIDLLPYEEDRQHDTSRDH